MKKFALAAALATVFSTSAMAAPAFNSHYGKGSQHRVEQRYDDRGRNEARQDQSHRVSQRSWKKGERFDSREARNYRQISQPKAYGLKNAPSGQTRASRSRFRQASTTFSMLSSPTRGGC